MKRLFARNSKTRFALAIETLEDRRLLSFFGPPSGSDGGSSSMDSMPDHAELAPPTWGSMGSMGGEGQPSDPGSMDRSFSMPNPESGPNGRFSDGPGNNFPSISSGSGSATDCNTNPSTPQPSPATWSGLDPIGNASTGTAGTGPVSASAAPTEKAATPANESQSTPAISSGNSSPIPSSFAVSAYQPARASSPVSVDRSVGNLVQTSHTETVGPANPLLLSMTDNIPGGSDGPRNTPATASTVPDLSVAPGWTIAQASTGFDTNLNREANALRSTEAVPLTSTRVPEAENLVEVAILDRSQTVDGFDTPEPQMADMIMNLFPFDRSSMEDAVDRFLEPFDELASWMPPLDGFIGLVSASLGVAATVLVVDLSLRIRRAREEQSELARDEHLVGFPGLPGLGRLSRS